MNFEDIHVNKFFMKKQVFKSIGIAGMLSHGFMRNDPLELTLMHKLNVRCRFRPSSIIKQFLPMCTIISNFAEVMAILESAELAIDKRWGNILIESDSKAAVTAFGTSELPWEIKPQWKCTRKKLSYVLISSTWREVKLRS
ncbi:hypothetical protein IFM89_021649 [Coptis chinensis]|uniref:RNase H type-1 domain-containing protein n=1 Tax=Coptis chinensis TaxID=261450 RepID=A0A835IEG7_9MAGN|nr:hypothetical protein IFM89_021649 [Coptis chinensis]